MFWHLNIIFKVENHGVWTVAFTWPPYAGFFTSPGKKINPKKLTWNTLCPAFSSLVSEQKSQVFAMWGLSLVPTLLFQMMLWDLVICCYESWYYKLFRRYYRIHTGGTYLLGKQPSRHHSVTEMQGFRKTRYNCTQCRLSVLLLCLHNNFPALQRVTKICPVLFCLQLFEWHTEALCSWVCSSEQTARIFNFQNYIHPTDGCVLWVPLCDQSVRDSNLGRG